MSQMPLDKPQKKADPQTLDFLNEIINSQEVAAIKADKKMRPR